MKPHLLFFIIAIAVAQNSTEYENITELADNCEVDNSTCITTVAPLEVNTTANSNTTKIKKKGKKKEKKPKETLRLVEKKHCPCNLQVEFCEINCCCDKDCSNNNKFAFKFCSDYEQVEGDPKFCNYFQQGYINNTLYEWEMHQSSLFCITRTNLPKSYTVQEKQIIKSVEEAEYFKKQKLSWPQLTFNVVESESSINYTYGDDVWILKNYTKVYKLEIPDSFLTDACLMKKQAKYLENLETSCSRSAVNEFQVVDYYTARNLTVLSLPQMQLANITRTPDCPRNVCIPFDVHVCQNNSCRNHTYPETTCAFGECKNLVERVKYVFHHNGTNGIRKATVYLDLWNSTLEETEFSQTFQIEYLWDFNYTKNFTHLLSGNPGYQAGKPILVAHLVTITNVTVNSTSNETKVEVTELLERDGLDYTKSFMVLPKSVGGNCVLSNETNVPIEFGYNMITKCSMHQSIVVGNLTAREICLQVQDRIFELWSLKYELVRNRTVNLTVGYFGNANASRKQDWGVVLFPIYPLDVLNKTSGDFVGEEVRCYNIATTMRIDFYHAREDDQEKIAGTAVGFGDYLNLSFVGGNVMLAIRSEVMFFDITSERFQKYVSPPSLDLSLPHDFFYPFIKVRNYARRSRTDCALLIFMCVFVQIVKADCVKLGVCAA